MGVVSLRPAARFSHKMLVKRPGPSPLGATCAFSVKDDPPVRVIAREPANYDAPPEENPKVNPFKIRERPEDSKMRRP